MKVCQWSTKARKKGIWLKYLFFFLTPICPSIHLPFYISFYLAVRLSVYLSWSLSCPLSVHKAYRDCQDGARDTTIAGWTECEQGWWCQLQSELVRSACLRIRCVAVELSFLREAPLLAKSECYVLVMVFFPPCLFVFSLYQDFFGLCVLSCTEKTTISSVYSDAQAPLVRKHALLMPCISAVFPSNW